MASTMNRRNWLKAGSLLTGALAFAPSALTGLKAREYSGVRNTAGDVMTRDNSPMLEEDFIANVPPAIKARLSSNENPFGPSDKAKQAMIAAMGSSYLYGFMEARTLAQKIAVREGIDPKMVLLGAGSTPILHATAIYFSKNGGNIVTGDPSYADLPSFATRFNAKWVKVPLTSEYKLDLDAMEKAIDGETKLVCICNPNNPTGTSLDTAKLKAFCERVSKKVPIFIDEAYIDYLPDVQGTTLIGMAKTNPNIIVARTFSKLYGFAGLRIGYAIAVAETLEKLEPYNSSSLSSLSVQAALAAYDDQEYLKSALTKTLASRDYLYSVLKAEGYEYIPSSANFVMFPINMEAKRFGEELLKRGVSIRTWQFSNKNWCRISIGTMDEMKTFAAAFKEIS